MKKKLLSYLCPVLVLCSLGYLVVSSVQASDEGNTCIAYFHGIGCPRCAKYDPIVLGRLLNEYPKLVVIEYEIYRQDQNATLLYDYHAQYDSGWHIPLMIFNKGHHILSGIGAEDEIYSTMDSLTSNECPLIDGSSEAFAQLDPTLLPGYPKLWSRDRVLIKTGPEGRNGELLRNLLVCDDVASELEGADFQAIKPIPVPLSGRDAEFENGVLLGDWVFQWRGEGLGIAPVEVEIELGGETPLPETEATRTKFTLFQIVSLAAVDAINPCAFAVLILMLTTVIAYNPGNRRSILLSGLAFVASVFILYFLYGLVIIKFFQVVQALTAVRIFIFKGLGVAAMVFGVLNIRDFVRYKPGRLGTEMPLLMRPRVQKLISRITSTKGAFLVGVFVSIFLLPCTIGPYVIAGGILSVFEMMENVPPLLLYNLIFVLPMLGIVGGVYLGFRRVEDFSSWKDRNISKLHLVAGILMLGIGIVMFLGLV